MQPVTIHEQLRHLRDYWHPRIVAELNGQQVKVAKVRGEFVWHHHAEADELFLVLDGRLTIRLRDGEVHLDPGDVFVVPRGVEHQPVAETETHILLFEPAGTVNTGNVRDERTRDRLERA